MDSMWPLEQHEHLGGKSIGACLRCPSRRRRLVVRFWCSELPEPWLRDSTGLASWAQRPRNSLSFRIPLTHSKAAAQRVASGEMQQDELLQ
jgi:hypothetical protein